MDNVARFLKKYFHGMEIDFEMTEIIVRKARFIEERFFEIFLSNKKIMDGLYFAGRGKHYMPWFEVSVYGKPYQQLFNRMFELLPQGGHVSIYYSVNEETGREIEKSVPSAITEKGFLLVKSGARWFKNWYFSEGFMEGDTKIQGDKTNDKNHIKNLKDEIKAFIKRGGPKQSIERAKEALRFL